MRLGYAPSVPVNVCESVVAILRSHEDKDAFGALANGRVLPRREHHVWHLGHGLPQSRVRGDRVLPNLVSVGCQVNLAIGVSVQDAGALVV